MNTGIRALQDRITGRCDREVCGKERYFPQTIWHLMEKVIRFVMETE